VDVASGTFRVGHCTRSDRRSAGRGRRDRTGHNGLRRSEHHGLAVTAVQHAVIVLIPIAIAINIVLGQTVAAALKLPIYLDSIGTILVGAIAGPVPGMLTGLLANLIWTYVLPAPFNSQYAAPFCDRGR